MRKYFFIFFFGVFLIANPVFAAVDPNQQFTDAQCESPAPNGQGGICKKVLVSGGGCDGTQDRIGKCESTIGIQYACCAPKEGGTNISEEKCETAITNGGLGGECLTGCTSLQTGDGAQAMANCGENLFANNLYCCVSEESKAATEKESGIAAVGAVNSGTKYTPLENVPFIKGTTFQDYVLGLYRLGLVLVVLSAVFMLVIGGFTYLTSAGNTSAISSAKHIIYGALIGLVLALVSYIILNTINPDLVNVNVTSFQPLAIQEGASGGEVSGDPDNEAESSEGACTPIPDSQLKAFPSGASDNGSRRGTITTVDRFMTMRAAALRDGITLKAGSAYRPPQEGEDLWKSHCCKISGGKTVCSCGSLVAKPCSLGGKGSNHQKGTAIDIKTGGGGTNWLRKNAAQYGFYNKIASEPWHWSDTGH